MLRWLKTTLMKKVRTDLQEIYGARNEASEKLRELLEAIVKKIEELYEKNKALQARVQQLEERTPENDDK